MPLPSVTPGTYLVAEPFITDPTFYRKVVIVLDKDEEGTVGLVINKPSDYIIGEPEADDDLGLPIHDGGPVDPENSFQFLHRASWIHGSQELIPGLFWGGNMEAIVKAYTSGQLNKENLLCYRGYCGWAPGQLEKELEAKSWILAPPNSSYLFLPQGEIWTRILQDLGGSYSWLAKAPISVDLN
ncbi:MAG: YqgE/AlgH family protein [Bacteroidia bacterium]